MKSVKQIDYLQFSVHEIPEFLGAHQLWSGSPLGFYRKAAMFACGAIVHAGNNKTTKYLIQMPGSSCARWDMTEYPARLAHIQTAGGRFSRVDFAVTVEGRKPLRNFREAVRCQNYESKRFPKDEVKVISDASGAIETVYLGDLRKRAKKGVFRAYDKGLEQGLLDCLTRFELEVRQDSADVAVRRFTEGATIGNLIAHVIDLPDAQWWRSIMGSKSNGLPRKHYGADTDPDAKRWHWLHTQIAPALARLMILDRLEQTRNIERFFELVQRELDRQTKIDMT